MNTATWYRRLRIARMRSARIDGAFVFAKTLVTGLVLGAFFLAIVHLIAGCTDTTTLRTGVEAYTLVPNESAPDGGDAQVEGGPDLIDAAEGGEESDTASGVDATGDDAEDAPVDAPVCTTYTPRVANVSGQSVLLPSDYYLDNEGAVEETPSACLCVETYDCACIVAAVKAAGDPCLGNLTGCYVDVYGVVRANCEVK